MIVLPDAGSELPAVFAEVAAVCAASEAEEITFGLADVDSGESVSQADIAGEFLDDADEQSAVGGSVWTAIVLVNMVNMQIDNVGDDQFSPGIGNAQSLRKVIVIVLRTVGVGHKVMLILMTSESIRRNAIGTLRRETRVFGEPMAYRRTGILYIQRTHILY